MAKHDYDVAQICLNGHVINRYVEDYPEDCAEFCRGCGAKSVTACQRCKTEIQGGLRGVFSFSGAAPSFCHACGAPYPWTKAKLAAAKAMTRELDDLSAAERGVLAKSLDDLIRDTPRTPLAATRFKKLLAKVGRGAAEALGKVVLDIASEAAKRELWPKP